MVRVNHMATMAALMEIGRVTEIELAAIETAMRRAQARLSRRATKREEAQQ